MRTPAPHVHVIDNFPTPDAPPSMRDRVDRWGPQTLIAIGMVIMSLWGTARTYRHVSGGQQTPPECPAPISATH
jgi:hypothetical protein